MRFRQFFTPSFRNRLRLFFVVIVVVPMVAVALVLFRLVSASQQGQTDAQLGEAQRVALNQYRNLSRDADAAGQEIAGDQDLAAAIRDRDQARIQSRMTSAATASGADRALLRLDDQGEFETGTDPAVAPARNALQDQDGKPVGRLVTSVATATEYATRLANTAEVAVVISQNGSVIA